MRIAALQFTPRLGKVDANIRRADEVLAKAMKRFDAKKPLDLLVLPEMAFSGMYTFPHWKWPLSASCFVILRSDTLFLQTLRRYVPVG